MIYFMNLNLRAAQLWQSPPTNKQANNNNAKKSSFWFNHLSLPLGYPLYAITYFLKQLQLRCLTGFPIHLSKFSFIASISLATLFWCVIIYKPFWCFLAYQCQSSILPLKQNTQAKRENSFLTEWEFSTSAPNRGICLFSHQ